MDERWWYLVLFLGTLLPVTLAYFKMEQVATRSDWRYPDKVTGILKIKGPIDIVDKLYARSMGILLEEEDEDQV